MTDHMTDIPGVTIRMAGRDGDIMLDGELIGKFHQVSGYPPSAATLSGRSIGGKSKADVIKALVAIVQTERLGIDFKGVNIFPKEVWILRVSDIAYNVSPDPDIKPDIVAKVHFNSHLTTGSSAASKPASSRVMVIDLDAGTFTANGKVHVFANQKAIIKALKEQVDARLNAIKGNQ